MIQSHQMKNGGVQIVKVHFVFDCIIAVFISLTILYSALETTATEPLCHGMGINAGEHGRGGSGTIVSCPFVRATDEADKASNFARSA